ncbi:hypothetical protein POX_c03583 [Penicillium oxalicum]|uniref:Basic-leucine zipper transcription factor POX06509 n=1 Tax=Penicillium oxalicum TaxID=69781 RepID=A0A3G2KSB1_PENOX|nr:hypothetical protein POX_c03583 [Penicillium oxalicum]AYN62242.1 basic-leucine zipper transcription factor POX06509 [Penicillium oxalicum]KAI2790735.1 hypothetical protein POX_c03583 [Penicillium oxalicum]
MATLAEHPMLNTASPMPMNTSFDQDLDSFINLDQLGYTSADAARPKLALAGQPTVTGIEYNASDARSTSFASSAHSPLVFPAPSHHYEEHHQQTGLPPGALSLTYNHIPQMNFNSGAQGFPMMKRENSMFNFNTAPSRNPSEMELEPDGMNHVPFLFQAGAGKNQYVDPNALGGHELAQAGPSTQVGRMYPGMHQQQAAMAKAMQQKQSDLMRQQQMQQPASRETSISAPTQDSRQPDPIVEERISRLLQQMRENAGAAGDASPSPSSILPHMAKAKKDEADMDEDERLLASEEGKKLSSKERRQLRNKVSARAFRSRRKEYIGQLENEITARTNEAHELRLQNKALFEENARLNDLARMLLGSPHFASFLNDMPDTLGASAQQPQPQQSQLQPHQQQSQPSQPQIVTQPPMSATIPIEASTASSQQFPLQPTPQVSMPMVPNPGMDPSVITSNGWNSGIDMNFGNAHVFAVLDVPSGPELEIEALCGKPSAPCSSDKNEITIPDLPDIPDLDSIVEKAESSLYDDSGSSLFADTPASSNAGDSALVFDGIAVEKSRINVELVTETPDQITAADRNRLRTLCQSMHAAFERVSTMTSHLQ